MRKNVGQPISDSSKVQWGKQCCLVQLEYHVRYINQNNFPGSELPIP